LEDWSFQLRLIRLEEAVSTTRFVGATGALATVELTTVSSAIWLASVIPFR
jgi:hypothetical protein